MLPSKCKEKRCARFLIGTVKGGKAVSEYCLQTYEEKSRTPVVLPCFKMTEKMCKRMFIERPQTSAEANEEKDAIPTRE